MYFALIQPMCYGEQYMKFIVSKLKKSSSCLHCHNEITI